MAMKIFLVVEVVGFHNFRAVGQLGEISSS